MLSLSDCKSVELRPPKLLAARGRDIEALGSTPREFDRQQRGLGQILRDSRFPEKTLRIDDVIRRRAWRD